ncbi:MAG TPA: acyl-CoA dehydrogenase family protein [Polyangiaceae bacterium]|jgi:alkylation response protein AidB-like acyl-CoA dehydrogenase
MPFFQTPPELGNTFDDDRMLRSYLARKLPGDARAAIERELREVGAIAGGPLYKRSLEEGRDEPKLVPWDAWGHRVDRIEVSSLWREAQKIAAERGVVGAAYERKYGEHSRVLQFSLVYLLEPSWHVYSCPLAMTDGAGRTLLASGNTALIERALPRLTSRDPAKSWTSGQWMTERTGGSDVAISETIAKADGDKFRLYGTKWFSSATTSQMAITLARPEGNPPGGSGLALFYLEVRNDDGSPNGVFVNRLKDKLGTRMVPTAELTLDGALATPIVGTRDGIKHITPMLTTTRTWNAVCAASGMHRAMTLAADYAKKRVAFGAPLVDKPLHVDTLGWATAETWGAFLLAYRAVELIGKEESRTLTEDEAQLLRLVVPIAKLTTGKQGVAVSSEALESFGGAGYIEDTGLPRMLRDAQVLPIWEGTTNVLSLDVLRVLARGGSLEPLIREVARCVQNTTDASLRTAAETASRALAHAGEWVMTHAGDKSAVEQGARRFALTLGRAIELALLCEHAQWALDHEKDARFAAAARLFAKTPIDLIQDVALDDARALLS